MEIFQSYDDDNSVKTAELDRHTQPTAPCKQYQVIGGRCVLYLHGRVSPVSHSQVISCELSFWICGQMCIPLAWSTHNLYSPGCWRLRGWWGIVKSISSRRTVIHQDGFVAADFTTRGFLGMFLTKSPETDVLDLTAYYVRIQSTCGPNWHHYQHNNHCGFGPLFRAACDSVPSLFGIWKTVQHCEQILGRLFAALETSNNDAALSAPMAFTVVISESWHCCGMVW